ncbi:RluA family pseudouridine synthase [Paenibacillus sp. CAA11]|nr:RluA family pseudouridine synthase [Paenibacillus sp. CAA11]
MPGKAVKGAPDPLAAASQWLQSSLAFPPKLLQQLHEAGGIRLAGDRLRLRMFLPREPGFAAISDPPLVLYEDDFCLVVHKPAGCKVHPDGEERKPTLAHAVAAHYAASGEQAAVRHIHRLDEYTSGPVLYAKNEFAQLKLDSAMARKEIHRVYIAIAQGEMKLGRMTIDAPIGRDRHHPKRRRVSPTGKPAVTHLECLEVLRGASLVRLQLETGRTHQIRVHMSHIGHPLLGDELYGGDPKRIRYQALHGEALEFVHPLTGEFISVNDPWPPVICELHDQLKR